MPPRGPDHTGRHDFLMADQQLSAPVRALSGVRHINRAHHTRFVVIGNHLAQHDELSLTAIGLSTHIQSLP
ncbi:helix-turn-helix domain-containing protein, partial [Streptomyces sp. NPDC127106]